MAGHVGGVPVKEWEVELPPAFWANIKVPDDPKTECWEWQGIRFRTGYARWNQHNWGYQAHRLSYGYYIGEIEDGKYLDHLCMNKCCVNPYHLDPVTPAENIRRWAEQTIQTCPKGHPYTKANLVAGATRACLQCRRDDRWGVTVQNTRPDSAQRRRGRRVNLTTNLGYLIDRSGLLLYEVAGLAGINHNELSRASNTGKMSIRTQQALCDLFEVGPAEIVGDRERSTAEPG